MDALVAGREEVVVEGGTVRIRLVDLPSPLHLAISPYPNQYEWTTRTKGGIEVFIRPVRPEDAPLLLELFGSMSSQSIWFRFMGPVKSLSPEMVHQMTQIDYDRDIALVALGKSEAPGKMLGCCHLVKHPRYRLGGDRPDGRGCLARKGRGSEIARILPGGGRRKRYRIRSGGGLVAEQAHACSGRPLPYDPNPGAGKQRG